MKTRFMWIAGAVTLLALSMPAFAQDDSVKEHRVAPNPVSMNGHPYVGKGSNGMRDSDRLIFSPGFPPPGGWAAAGNAHAIYDELTFTPGCGSGGGPYDIDGINFAWQVNTGGTKADFDLRFTFFGKHVGGLDDTTTPPYDPDTEIGQFTISYEGVDGGYFYTYEAPIPFDSFDPPLDPIHVESTTIGYRLECFQPGTETYHSDVQPIVRSGLTTLPSGASDQYRWTDVDGDHLIAQSEHNVGTLRTIFVEIQATVGDPAEPSATDLGTLSDGVTTQSGNATNSVKFYKLAIPNDATDVALQFLDIDTEGSSDDVMIGLYDGSGELAGVGPTDDGSGSGSNDQLTYGIGIRAGVGGDGLPYDGRSGELSAGTYFAAVAPVGSSFGDCYNVIPATGGGDYTINFNTNTNGSALAPVVEPSIDEDIGELTAPGWAGLGFQVPRLGVVWHKFSICGPATDPATYVDLDYTGSDNLADIHAYIFDADGNLVVDHHGNGAGGGLWPQFSWGNVGPRPPYSGVDGDPQFAGDDGKLPAGTYYLAEALADGGNSTSVGSRFNVRSHSGSSLTEVGSFYTDIDDPDDCGGGSSTILGDSNLDGFVNFADIDCFVAALISESDWNNCGLDHAPDAGDYSAANNTDKSDDGSVNFNDIDSFVTCLINEGCP